MPSTLQSQRSAGSRLEFVSSVLPRFEQQVSVGCRLHANRRLRIDDVAETDRLAVQNRRLARLAVDGVIDRERFQRLQGRVVSFAQSPRREPTFAAVDDRLDLGRHVARSARIAQHAVRGFLHHDFRRIRRIGEDASGRPGSRRRPDRELPGRGETRRTPTRAARAAAARE